MRALITCVMAVCQLTAAAQDSAGSRFGNQAFETLRTNDTAAFRRQLGTPLIRIAALYPEADSAALARIEKTLPEGFVEKELFGPDLAAFVRFRQKLSGEGFNWKVARILRMEIDTVRKDRSGSLVLVLEGRCAVDDGAKVYLLSFDEAQWSADRRAFFGLRWEEAVVLPDRSWLKSDQTLNALMEALLYAPPLPPPPSGLPKRN